MRKLFFTLFGLFLSSTLIGRPIVIVNPEQDEDIELKVNDGGVVTDALKIDGATSWIGLSTDPAAQFHVKSPSGTAGRVLFDNSALTDASSIGIRKNGSDFLNIGIEGSSSTLMTGSAAYEGIINLKSAGNLVFGTNDARRMTIDFNGLVGMGSLPVASRGLTIASSPILRLTSSAADRTASTGYLEFWNSTEDLRIGYFGYGSSSNGHISLTNDLAANITLSNPSGSLTLDSTGNTIASGVLSSSSLSINTSSGSDYIIEVNSTRGDSTRQKLLRLTSNTYASTSNNFEIENGQGIYFSARNDGKIGVGTTNIQGNLSVAGQGRVVSIGDSGIANVPIIKSRNIEDTAWGFLGYGAYSHYFYTNGSASPSVTFDNNGLAKFSNGINLGQSTQTVYKNGSFTIPSGSVTCNNCTSGNLTVRYSETDSIILLQVYVSMGSVDPGSAPNGYWIISVPDSLIFS